MPVARQVWVRRFVDLTARSELDTFVCRESEKERHARTSIRRSQTPVVGFHDGAADPQPNSHALWFSRIERLHNMLHNIGFDAATQILHRDPHG